MTPLTYDHYVVEELPSQRGKFGGYKCIPKLNDSSEGKYGTLYRLNIPIKYDANKELDKTVSNNMLPKR